MKKIILISSLLLLAVIFFTACSNDNKDNPKATPTIAVSTEAATPTIEPTPSETLEPITNKGLPQKDAEVLITEDFEDGSFNADEFELILDQYLTISEGEMHITQEWSAVAPIYTYELGTKHHQYEFSMDYYSTFDRQSAPHVAYWVGSRVPEEKYAAYPGGFWLAFTQGKVIHVYPGGDNFEGKEHWAEKYFDIQAPEDFKSVHKITVVDTGDALYYYMNTAQEENYLLIKVVFDGADLLCYNKDNKEIWAGENAVNEEVGFSIFSHRSATHTDNITLKAY